MPDDSLDITIPDDEIEIVQIRAQGAGGQNVNKVSNAVHLRFDIGASSLPQAIKARLLQVKDQRISADGIVVIKAQRYRSLEKNREDAIERLRELVAAAAFVARRRIPTRPSASSRRERVESKVHRGRVKSLRGKVGDGGGPD